MADFTLTLKDSYGRTIAKTDDSGGKKVDIIGTKTKTQIGGNDYTRVVAKTTDETTGEEEVATGYVEDEELEQWYEETVSIPSNFAGLEAAMVPTRLRDQLFEITEVNEGDDYVEITALHIFYRQRQNSTTWEPGKTTKYSGAAACRNVMQNVLFDTGFYVASDSTDMILGDELDYARKNIVECFLNPESGICAKYGLSLIRDNDVFYCLKNVGFDRGFVVQSGKNLLGVQRTESIENIITRVAPLGRDADGNLVWMNYEGSNYVDSSHINEYASPRLEILQTDIQVGRDGVTAENIHEKLREKALARFSEDEVDIPEVTMTIEFISLGDTEEYQQYRDLDRVYLYDIVHIKDETRGYSYGAQVIGVRHNILTGRLESCTIGTPQPWDGVRKVAVWRMPEIDGSLIRQNTIRAGKFMTGAIKSADIGDGEIKADHLSSTGTGNAADAIKRLSLEQLIVENTSPDGLLHTRFAVTEGLIQSEVTRATSAETSMGTRITQNENAITLEANRATSAENSISSALTVEAGKISMVVGTNSSGNFIKAAEIATSINEAGEGVATIDADKVYIGNEKSTTVINGKLDADSLTANLIQSKIADLSLLSANALSVAGGINGSGTLTVAGLATLNGSLRLGSGNSFSSCIVSAEKRDNGNTLRLTDSSGNVTDFSKATSVGGNWSGVTFNFSATQNGVTVASGSTSVALDLYGSANIIGCNVKNGNTTLDSKGAELVENVSDKKVYCNLTGGSGSTIAQISTSDTFNAGVAAGIPTGVTLGSKVTGTVYNVSIARGSYSAVGKTIDLASAYTDARAGYYTKAQYDANYTAGYNAGSSAGYSSGYSAGYDAGKEAGYTSGNAAGKKTGYNEALSDAGVPNGGTVYTGTWRGRLWDAPHQNARPVDNCLAGASYHTLTKK